MDNDKKGNDTPQVDTDVINGEQVRDYGKTMFHLPITTDNIPRQLVEAIANSLNLAFTEGAGRTEISLGETPVGEIALFLVLGSNVRVVRRCLEAADMLQQMAMDARLRGKIKDPAAEVTFVMPKPREEQ